MIYIYNYYKTTVHETCKRMKDFPSSHVGFLFSLTEPLLLNLPLLNAARQRKGAMQSDWRSFTHEYQLVSEKRIMLATHFFTQISVFPLCKRFPLYSYAGWETVALAWLRPHCEREKASGCVAQLGPSLHAKTKQLLRRSDVCFDTSDADFCTVWNWQTRNVIRRQSSLL